MSTASRWTRPARFLNNAPSDWAVYVPGEAIYPPEGECGATCEIVENQNGELVCYIEMATVLDVRAAVVELELEIV